MQFSPQSGPGASAAASGALRSLRPALNAPVVSIAELPVGPASAVIAVHEAPDGLCSLTLAIRCQRTDEVVFFGPGVEGREPDFAPHATEAATSFAEGMGFLFDDDMLADPRSGPEAAAQLWEGFADHAAELAPRDVDLPAAVGQAIERPMGGAVAEILTKFRSVSGGPLAGAEAG